MMNEEHRQFSVDHSPSGDRAPLASHSAEAAIDVGLPVSSTARTLLVEFRSGEAVQGHPEIAPYLSDGWRLQKAVPKLVDGRIRLLAVLERKQTLFT